jgi:hypothetical protein
MNKDFKKNVRFTLKSIQSRNQELCKKLQCLQQEVRGGAKDVSVESSISTPGEENEAMTEYATSQLVVIRSLQAELDVARSVVGMKRSYHAMRQSCGVADPSYNNTLFGKELTRTYNDLVQTNQALVDSNMHLMEQQQRLRDYLHQQTIIKDTLSLWVEGQLTQSTSSKRQKLAEIEDSPPHLKEHLEWLRKELTYVSKIVECHCSRSSQHDSGSLEHKNEGSAGVVSQLFSDLIREQISAKSGNQDPYIDISHVDPSIIELLKQCGVVQCHTDDSNYISLVDFTM